MHELRKKFHPILESTAFCSKMERKTDKNGGKNWMLLFIEPR